MPKKKSVSPDSSITDYRHNSTRKNIPPAGLAAQGKVKDVPKKCYFYDPHPPPALRFDPSGAADHLPKVLEIARQRPLTAEEAELLAEALQNRQAWCAKMDDVNAIIAASAPQAHLVDQPKVVSGMLRVSGLFTIECVQPVEQSLDLDSPIEGMEGDLETFNAADASLNAAAYLDETLHLLRLDSVLFPDNKTLRFSQLEPLNGGSLHATGEWGGAGAGDTCRAAVTFGPQHGPIATYQVEEALPEAYRRGYANLIVAGFTYDDAAQAVIQDDPNLRVRCHSAHILLEVNVEACSRIRRDRGCLRSLVCGGAN